MTLRKETKETKSISIRIPVDTYALLQEEANKADIYVSRAVIQIVTEWVDATTNPPPQQRKRK